MGRRLASYICASTTIVLAACGRGESPCRECGTVRVAAVREPASILPPMVFETVGRDISDRVYERLANFQAGGATIDPTAYRPALALVRVQTFLEREATNVRDSLAAATAR